MSAKETVLFIAVSFIAFAIIFSIFILGLIISSPEYEKDRQERLKNTTPEERHQQWLRFQMTL